MSQVSSVWEAGFGCCNCGWRDLFRPRGHSHPSRSGTAGDCVESRFKQPCSACSSIHPASQQGSDECIGISGVSVCACCFPRPSLGTSGRAWLCPLFTLCIFRLFSCYNFACTPWEVTVLFSVLQRKKYNCYCSKKQGKHGIIQGWSSLRTLDHGECWISKQDIFYKHKPEELIIYTHSQWNALKVEKL